MVFSTPASPPETPQVCCLMSREGEGGQRGRWSGSEGVAVFSTPLALLRPHRSIFGIDLEENVVLSMGM